MHSKEFQSLDRPFDGLEKEFELRFKFEEKESDDFFIDPNTGVKAYAQPFLALYVSTRPESSSSAAQTLPQTLHYARPRSSLSGGLHANESDQERLLEDASPFITADLRTLLDGKNPRSLQKFVVIS